MAPIKPNLVEIDSQALIKSYNRNVRAIFLITGAFMGIVLYGFSVNAVTLLWLVIALFAVLIIWTWSCSFLLKSMFIDKSLETLLRRTKNA